MVFWSVGRSEETSGVLLASSWTNRRAWFDFMAESVWRVFPVNQDGFLTFYLFYFPSPSTSYNSLNNARNGSGFHIEQQEMTLYK